MDWWRSQTKCSQDHLRTENDLRAPDAAEEPVLPPGHDVRPGGHVRSRDHLLTVSRVIKETAAPAPPEVDDVGRDTFWDRVHSLEASFHKGLAAHDARQSTNALLELDRGIWQAQADLENEEFGTQARDTLRDLIARLGTELASAWHLG